MLYWNLYHAPLKRAVFVIVAVLFAITDIFQYKSIVDVSHQKKNYDHICNKADADNHDSDDGCQDKTY